MCAESQIERHKDNVIKGLQQKINTLETDQQRIDLLLEIEELINSYSPPSIDDILPPDNATSKGRPRNTGGKRLHSKFELLDKKAKKERAREPDDSATDLSAEKQENEFVDPKSLLPGKRDLEDKFLEKQKQKRKRTKQGPTWM